ncbi:hypothetical protein F4779DRAFT_641419 [Xylariaceae sp. FL0662B]|nr:hypothetical protein F4779DRAFT_641419 [Xylariaceae sp. FL0662B]
MCLLVAGGLLALLWVFDGKLEPEWRSDLQFSTIVIAVMSAYRMALKGIVETCVSQGAWIWVSGFRKGRTEARLEDFKMFDEAAKGLWGCLVLLWRMKGKHLACVGAVIMLLIQGFETFSSQMVQFNERPTVFIDGSNINASPAPPPPRAETWHNVVPKGRGGEMSLGLSTKAAIYDGIIAGTIPTAPAFCSTANCTWPIFPTLAVCGNCTESSVKTSCDQKSCAYNVTVTNGIHNSRTIANWSKTNISTERSAHFDEYEFVDIPPELYVKNQTRFAVPTDSIEALRSFMGSLMLGNASEIGGVVDYSSDWVQAMQNATSDLTAWIEKLSLSMTNDIRSSGTFDATKMLEYSGNAYIMASHIQTVWRTARDQVCAWKGDSLPMLFCHVQKSIYALVRDGMDVPEGLNDRIGRTEVELVRKDDGQWIFREPINH